MAEQIPADAGETSGFSNRFLRAGQVNGLNRPWMYMFTLLLTITGYILYQNVAALFLMPRLLGGGYKQEEIMADQNLLFNSEALGLDRNVLLLVELGMFVCALAALVLGLRGIHKKTITSVMTGFSKFRFRHFFTGFVVWAVLLFILFLIQLQFQSEEWTYTFNPEGFLLSVLIMLFIMPFQTGWEEILFRGYMVQGLSLVFRNGLVAVLITSLLFGLVHMSNPEVQQYGWSLMFPYYVLFAFFFGLITLLDQGLELAFGIHFANNLVSSALVTTQHSVVKTYSIFETPDQDPATELIIWALLSCIAFLFFLYKFRWRNFSLLYR